MTHGRGKSDSAIVTGKPTNKAERSAAEPVEPRAEAAGEWEPAKHGPDTEPGSRVTGTGAHTTHRENIAKRRYTPEVGAIPPKAVASSKISSRILGTRLILTR
jgi:hypothetical protein